MKLKSMIYLCLEKILAPCTDNETEKYDISVPGENLGSLYGQDSLYL